MTQRLADVIHMSSITSNLSFPPANLNLCENCSAVGSSYADWRLGIGRYGARATPVHWDFAPQP